MKNILIHMFVDAQSEYDIFTPTDYALMSEGLKRRNGICPNFGNRVWFQGLISEIQSESNQISFFKEEMSKDYINSNFDMIIAPMANVFSVPFISLLESLTERFRGVKIPVYVIACGVQANSYDDLDELCNALRIPATNFIKSIYNTGGEFALRGYFSKEFFDRLGFSSAVVTGCPSLYQLGRNLRIPEAKVVQTEFKPLLNGKLSNYIGLLDSYEGMQFFDQETFFNELHNRSYFCDGHSMQTHLKRLIKQYGFETTQWLLQDKIKLLPNLNEWQQYLIQEKFNFSFGGRIHGSIMPLLSGIPAVLEAHDSRTREMAEFFDIPLIKKDEYQKFHSLYDLYTWADYSKFNQTFGQKFDAFETFLIDRSIVDHINEKNTFFTANKNVKATAVNQEYLAKMATVLQNSQLIWKIYDNILQLKRKII